MAIRFPVSALTTRSPNCVHTPAGTFLITINSPLYPKILTDDTLLHVSCTDVVLRVDRTHFAFAHADPVLLIPQKREGTQRGPRPQPNGISPLKKLRDL